MRSRTVRDGFMGAMCGTSGLVLASGFGQHNLTPAVIWLLAFTITITFGRPRQ